MSEPRLIGDIIESISRGFEENGGWLCSGGLYYVRGEYGMRVYTRDEFDKIRHLFVDKNIGG